MNPYHIRRDIAMRSKEFTQMYIILYYTSSVYLEFLTLVHMVN